MKKILIIDDEQFNIESVKIILEYQGGIYNIETVSSTALNGLEAVNLIKKNVEDNNGTFSNYPLILTDLNMPVMDGNTAALQIREYLYNKGLEQPIIIAITGHCEDTFVKEALKDGINMVVGKPLKYEYLKEVLMRLGYV
jgi:CheY-like chemotaxis protein